MNSVGAFCTARLSASLSKEFVRYGHVRPRFRPKQPGFVGFAPGHGEQIWVFSHLTTKQIIYSHKPVMHAARSLRQLPFNGKKTKPAKLRKDYWSPMAMIQFPEGLGVVGQNVFQKLREFKRLHELSWGDELLGMTKQERGWALNDQKANSVADMAAVLSGVGRGNKIRGEGQSSAVESADVAGPRSDLTEATIYWADERDQHYARTWSANVRHELGLPLRSEPAELESETEGLGEHAGAGITQPTAAAV